MSKKQQEQQKKFKRFIIDFIDVDGVLADCGHRLHYLQQKNYDAFYSDEEMMNDTTYKKSRVANVILGELQSRERYLNNEFGEEVVVAAYILTGRPKRTGKVTKDWINAHYQGFLDGIEGFLMRKDHDYRQSGIVKAENALSALEKLVRENTDEGVQVDFQINIWDDDLLNIIEVKKVLAEAGILPEQITGFQVS